MGQPARQFAVSGHAKDNSARHQDLDDNPVQGGDTGNRDQNKFGKAGVANKGQCQW